MDAKAKGKIVVDILMTIGLLLLMSYELIGSATHEVIGVSMFVLFTLHNVLNWRWSKQIFRGKYTAYRTLQTILVVLVFLVMFGQMISAIVLSRHVFAFLSIQSGQSWARIVHLLGANWGFVLISMHLGLHWNMVMHGVRRMVKSKPVPKPGIILLRIAAGLIAVWGVFAFVRRGVGRYMLLLDQFVFLDFSEPLILFLLDYLSIMGLFVLVGHYGAKAAKWIGLRQKTKAGGLEA